MIQKSLLSFLLICLSVSSSAQKQGQSLVDSLSALLPMLAEDSNKAKLLTRISNTYIHVNPDEGLRHGQEALDFEYRSLQIYEALADSYMCAAGLPAPNKTHVKSMIQAALEIMDFMQFETQNRKNKGQKFFEMRIGIHTGPVVAGIVGTQKFAYDIWGYTVNIAARMESSGETGKINISGSTYAQAKNHFICTPRGKVEAKNKGEIEMYFVEGPMN